MNFDNTFLKALMKVEIEDLVTPFWNKKNLKPPDIKSLKINSKNPRIISSQIAGILENISQKLQREQILHQDAAVMSRQLFRTKRMLGSHKAYKILKQTETCLSRYARLDLHSVVGKTRDVTFGESGPSREVMDWCLLNLLRSALLLQRLVALCDKAGQHLLHYISTGHTWDLATLSLACISRIRTVGLWLLNNSCDWYLQLKEYLPLMAVGGDSYLPKDWSLPEDPKSWLGMTSGSSCQQNSPLSPQESSSSPIPQPRISTHCDEEEIPEKITEEGLTQAGPILPTFTVAYNEDFGEKISRSSEKTNQDKKDLVGRPLKSFHSSQDIMKFIKSEEYLRRLKKNKSLTFKMKDKQWNILKKSLMKSFYDVKNSSNDKLSSELLNKAQDLLKNSLV